MKIKDLVKQDPGFQYVIDAMDLLSSAGRRCMLDTQYSTDAAWIEHQWQNTQQLASAMAEEANARAYTDLRHCLMQLHDLQGTLSMLSMHTTLSEVDLFELKSLALITDKATEAVRQLGLDAVLPLPDLSAVFSMLDPDNTGIANFYIYDTYHPRLGPLRRELKALQEHTTDEARISQLLVEQNELQQQICTALTDRLLPHHAALSAALETLAYADFLCAKTTLATQWHLVRPTIGQSISYRHLFNPRLLHRNQKLGQRYQPVSVALTSGVTLITGANMAGKTVLLKSVGTAQLMAQCGMFVPAEAATVCIVDEVMTSIGDEQNEMNGLSSYASEIIKISNIVTTARTHKLLVLIDEPARTTNPTEGKAIVQAVVELLQQSSSVSLITTHYGQVGAGCRCLRVKGFVENMADVPLTPANISRFIDYSLTEDTTGDIPHEALRIAAILGCDSQLIALAHAAVGGVQPA